MEIDMQEIIAVCRTTENKHFEKFANLVESHLDGIPSHADYPRSSAKVEGTNNRIKSIRRRACGDRDDTYLFNPDYECLQTPAVPVLTSILLRSLCRESFLEKSGPCDRLGCPRCPSSQGPKVRPKKPVE